MKTNKQGIVWEVFRALRANWLRTLLTMIGVIIGIAAVVTIMSLGATISKTVEKELTRTGLNTISIHPNWGKPTVQPLTVSTINQIKSYSVPGIIDVTGSVNTSASITDMISGYEKQSYIVGTDEKIQETNTIKLLAGRLISQEDVASSMPVILRDKKVVDSLFYGDIEAALESRVQLKGVSFSIIGVFASSEPFAENGMAYVPYPILMQEPIGQSNYSGLTILLDRTADVEETKNQLVAYALADYGVLKEDDLPLSISNPKSELNTFNQYMTGLSIVIALVAAISLIVGGVGIMNIMLVTVVERTREIGLMRSLGAQKKHVVQQFLMESMIITVFGGIVGVISGLLFTMLIVSVLNMFESLPDFSIGFSVPAIFISLLVAALIGLGFGYYPAKKAADLNPVEALRHE
jgi:ABC-type antimicrobial peptide transport system permease subunit